MSTPLFDDWLFYELAPSRRVL
ncbi:hypothetical protein MIC448_340011 [Microbacterium sp. C448]|nr:hypothetical protein MIC448_340011 [Microbacterium sp. C448]